LGARVVILDRDGERGKALESEFGENVQFAQADVTGEGEVQGAVNRAYGAFGGLGAVINCAGVAWAARTVGK